MLSYVLLFLNCKTHINSFFYEQVHLSNNFGTPILVDLLHAAAIRYLTPSPPKPQVPCQELSSASPSRTPIVMSPVRMPTCNPAPECTLVKQEVYFMRLCVKAEHNSVSEKTNIASHSFSFFFYRHQLCASTSHPVKQLPRILCACPFLIPILNGRLLDRPRRLHISLCMSCLCVWKAAQIFFTLNKNISQANVFLNVFFSRLQNLLSGQSCTTTSPPTQCGSATLCWTTWTGYLSRLTMFPQLFR